MKLVIQFPTGASEELARANSDGSNRLAAVT